MRTGAGYFDFYLLHSVEESHLKTYDKYDCWQWAMEMKEKGLIKHFGFSFHDSPEVLDKVLTDHPEVDFVQLQINYADWENQIIHSGKCYCVAKKHNKPIAIMEPVKGGMLASMKPELEAKLKEAAPDKSIASWAIRFCLSLDNVMVILSGMTSSPQMQDNINTVTTYKPFSGYEKNCLNEVAAELLKAPTIGCTSCRYCTDGCPRNIDIPGVFSACNTILTYGEHERPHMFYKKLISDGGRANSCIKCGKCEKVCPQHLKIVEELEKASPVFDKL